MKEATIVTTLTVTHVLRDCDEQEAQALAQEIARAAREATELGYRASVLEQGWPDDIAVSTVQVFTKDGEEGAE